MELHRRGNNRSPTTGKEKTGPSVSMSQGLRDEEDVGSWVPSSSCTHPVLLPLPWQWPWMGGQLEGSQPKEAVAQPRLSLAGSTHQRVGITSFLNK